MKPEIRSHPHETCVTLAQVFPRKSRKCATDGASSRPLGMTAPGLHVRNSSHLFTRRRPVSSAVASIVDLCGVAPLLGSGIQEGHPSSARKTQRPNQLELRQRVDLDRFSPLETVGCAGSGFWRGTSTLGRYVVDPMLTPGQARPTFHTGTSPILERREETREGVNLLTGDAV